MANYANPPYYLTAYGIAVKHGYRGTEEQWIRELYGTAAAAANGAFATPQMFGAKGNGINDDSAAVQAAVDSGTHVIIFPPGTYKVKGVTLRSGLTLMLGNAKLTADAANDWMFEADEADGIRVLGGRFERPGTELVKKSETAYGNDTSGVFRFSDCSRITIDGSLFLETWTLNNVRCIDCRDVIIRNCVTERYHAANFIFLNDCANVTVTNCEMYNGTNEGYQYIYPAASGFTSYDQSEGARAFVGITNYEISNCVIDNCDWEGADCHGGQDIRFINNRIINCYRWLTAYADNRPKIAEGVCWGNVVLEGNYCRNDTDKTFPHERITACLLMHGAHDKGRMIAGIAIRNNVFINTYVLGARYGEDERADPHRGAVNAYYTKELEITGNEFIFEEYPDTYWKTCILYMLYNYNAVIKNNRITGHGATGSVIRVFNSSAIVEGNTFISRPGTNCAGMITGVYVPGEGASERYKFYYRLSGNVGNYAAEDLTPSSRLYGPGELTKAADGYDGKQTSTAAPGLMSIKTNDAYTPITASAVAGSNVIAYRVALDKVIPGMAVTVTDAEENEVTAIVIDVFVDRFTISENIGATGECTVSFPRHERVTLFAPGRVLPSVDNTDEGKVLMVSNEGTWVAKAGRALPSVDDTDEGKVLTVSNEGTWVAADLPA